MQSLLSALPRIVCCLLCLNPVLADTPGDNVDKLVENGSFKTLVKALETAGLVPALKGQGPLTLFAPTDEAFAALPEGTLENLLKPENKGRLIALLTYHVKSGELLSSELLTLESTQMLLGQEIRVGVQNGRILINNATIVREDFFTANGIIHVIDKVLIPGGN